MEVYILLKPVQHRIKFTIKMFILLIIWPDGDYHCKQVMVNVQVRYNNIYRYIYLLSLYYTVTLCYYNYVHIFHISKIIQLWCIIEKWKHYLIFTLIIGYNMNEVDFNEVCINTIQTNKQINFQSSLSSILWYQYFFIARQYKKFTTSAAIND